jgi:hypothetical protein
MPSFVVMYCVAAACSAAMVGRRSLLLLLLLLLRVWQALQDSKHSEHAVSW